MWSSEDSQRPNPLSSTDIISLSATDNLTPADSEDSRGSRHGRGRAKVPFPEVYACVKQFTMQNRLENIQTRRQYRLPSHVRSKTEGAHTGVVSLLQKLNFRFVRKFSEEQILEMVRHMTIMELRDRDFVYHKDDQANFMYFVFAGEVEILGPITAGREPIAVYGPSDTFGEDDHVLLGNQLVRQYSAVASGGNGAILGCLHKDGFMKGKTLQRIMEDNKIYACMRKIPPFNGFAQRPLLNISMAADILKTPARTPLMVHCDDLLKYLVIVVRGEVEVRCQFMISPQEAQHLSKSSVPIANLGFADVPIGILRKGSTWGMDQFLDVSGYGTRDYTKGVEFSNFMLYPRNDECRCLLIPLRVVEENLDRPAKRWISVYCRNMLSIKRESAYQILQTLVKPDFQAKVSGYMRKMLEALEAAETEFHAMLKVQGADIIRDQCDRKANKKPERMGLPAIRKMFSSTNIQGA